jgi:small-conductance mechanosensitive channel
MIAMLSRLSITLCFFLLCGVGAAAQTPPTPTPRPPAGAKTPTPTPAAGAQATPSPGQEQKLPSPSPSPAAKETEKPASGEQRPEGEAQPSPSPAPGEKAAETPSPSPTAAQPSATERPAATAQPSPASPPAEMPTPAPPPPPGLAESLPAAQPSSAPAAAVSRAAWQEKIIQEIEGLAEMFSFWKVVLSLLALLFGYFANKLVALVLTRLGKRRGIQADRWRRVIPVVSFSLWFLTLLVVAAIFAQSALAAVILVIVAMLTAGIAAQPLLRDLIGGVVILMERPFQIGDCVTIGGQQGEVRKIGLRSFQLVSAAGAVVAIPNAEILRQPVANANPDTLESQVTTELLLPAEIDIEAAKKLAFEAAAISPYIYINRPIEVYVDEEYQNKLLIKIIVKAYVFDAQYERELRSNTVECARKGFQRLNPATG